MKWHHNIIATGAFLTAWLAWPGEGNAYVLLGGSLDLDQRDYRIFNNFTDPTANTYFIPDPDFPGAGGAELAIWKGAAEWNSRLHGSGGIDPSHADGIGSGASNFDSFYVGLADQVGSPDDNIISMISGTLAVHAYTEVPITDGWRIRFVEGPDSWQDQPDPANWTGPNRWDIQGTMTHEYGHALGLNHSSVPGATMGNSLQMAVDLRSIHADDMAGVQFLYGALDPNKPSIDTYTLSGNLVTLHGSGFDPLSNEVWLTQLDTAGPGAPVKVLGVPSSNSGTMLQFAFPTTARPGQVAVKIPGTHNAALSNVFPMDPTREPYFRQPATYGASKVSSSGQLPEIELLSQPSISHGSFTLDVTGGTNQGLGIIISGPTRSTVPFFGGTLWIGAPYVRERVFQFNFSLARVTIDVPAGVVPGDSRFYQLWFVDAGDPQGVGLSHGLWVTFSE